ncbi:hypothetical protein LTR39_003132 [Cryomyces antarcticus]|nr:hypothetical protein LTR39_003132 [Cryomyces antarcticus]
MPGSTLTAILGLQCINLYAPYSSQLPAINPKALQSVSRASLSRHPKSTQFSISNSRYIRARTLRDMDEPPAKRARRTDSSAMWENNTPGRTTAGTTGDTDHSHETDTRGETGVETVEVDETGEMGEIDVMHATDMIVEGVGETLAETDSKIEEAGGLDLTSVTGARLTEM